MGRPVDSKTQELSCLLSLLKNTRHSEASAINRRVVSSSPDQGCARLNRHVAGEEGSLQERSSGLNPKSETRS